MFLEFPTGLDPTKPPLIPEPPPS